MPGAVPPFVARRLDPGRRFGLRVTLLAVAFVLVAVPFATLLFQVLGNGPVTEFDGRVADAMNAAVHGRPVVVGALIAVSALGTPPALWSTSLAAVAWAWRTGARRVATFLVATTLGGGIVSSSIKVLVDRPRPEVDHPIVTAFGKSFPSGHALSSTVVYGAVLLAFLPVVPRRHRRAVVVATGCVVLAVGVSRLLLGVHFVTDVVAGHVLGVAWLAGATAVFELWRVDRGARRSDPLEEGIEPEEGDELATGEETVTRSR